MARRSSDPTVEALWTYFPIIPTSSVSTTQQEFLNLDATQLHDFHRPPKSGKPKLLNLPNETVKSVVLDLVVTSFASASRQEIDVPVKDLKTKRPGLLGHPIWRLLSWIPWIRDPHPESIENTHRRFFCNQGTNSASPRHSSRPQHHTGWRSLVLSTVPFCFVVRDWEYHMLPKHSLDMSSKLI